MMSFNDKLSEQIPRLRLYAQSLTKNRINAEDLLQSTLEKAIRKQATYEQGREICGWLFTMMHNVFIDGARAEKRRPSHICVDDVALESYDRADTLTACQELELALCLLPENHRKAIMLTAYGLSLPQAAGVLCVPVPTVKSWVRRGRTRLRVVIRGTIRSKSEPMNIAANSARLRMMLPKY